jgi:hypothetical protein
MTLGDQPKLPLGLRQGDVKTFFAAAYALKQELER